MDVARVGLEPASFHSRHPKRSQLKCQSNFFLHLLNKLFEIIIQTRLIIITQNTFCECCTSNEINSKISRLRLLNLVADDVAVFTLEAIVLHD